MSIMAQYLLTADVEAVLIGRLKMAFPEAAIYRTAPSTLPSKPVITIRRTGGLERSPYVDQAHMDIHVYAATDVAATALALRVQAYLNAQSGDSIMKITTSGPADLGGTTPRRFMYCDAILRREVREETL